MSEEKQETPAAPAAPAAVASKPLNVVIQDLEGDATKKVVYSKTFTVDYTNPDDGNRLVGTFTVKRPSLGDVSQYGLLKARYNGGERVARDIDYLNDMIAFCQVMLTTTPDWWDPLNSYDDDLLTLVYDHVRSFQDSFRKRLEK
jgi:hypothetical protein